MDASEEGEDPVIEEPPVVIEEVVFDEPVICVEPVSNIGLAPILTCPPVMVCIFPRRLVNEEYDPEANEDVVQFPLLHV